MKNLRKIRAMIAAFLAAAMFAASMPVGAVRAELVSTDRIISRMEVDTRRAEISAFLAREDMRQQIAAMGVTQEEAEMRVASMSDAEVMRVAGQLENLPAGQAQSFSIVVLLLLIIILILVI